MKYTTNIYAATILRIVLMLFILQISRLGFFLYNIDMFPNTDLITYLKLAKGGILFDVTALFYANIIFILMEIIPVRIRYGKTYQSIAKAFFFLMGGILLMINTADIIFYSFRQRRTTYTFFNEFGNDPNIGDVVLRSIADYWYMTVYFMLLIAFMIYGYNRIEIKRSQNENKRKYYSIAVLSFLIGIGIFIIGIRGGMHDNKPIQIDKANEFAVNLGEDAIVLNTPFSLFRTSGDQVLKEHLYFDKQTRDSLYSPIHIPTQDTKLRKKNVFIIILESFGKEYISSLNRNTTIKDYKGYTPFLDSIMDNSLYFMHAFANGNKSIMAVPAILSSIPSTAEPFVTSTYSQNKFYSTVSLLKDEGYESMFYLGANFGSLGISSFTKKAGINHYLSKDDFLQQTQNGEIYDDGFWGIFDEPFMQFIAKDIKQYKEPFIASMFTLSSHHPYVIPEEHKNKFKNGDLKMHNSIEYSDYALKCFFETIKKESWFENTLFVITADHTSDSFYKEYQGISGRNAIPIALYDPSGDLPKEARYENVNHLDIMPTILDYLGYNKPYFSFGKSILKPTDSSDFSVHYAQGAYIATQGEMMLVFDGKKATSLYNYRKDMAMTNNLLFIETEVAKKLEMKTKAFIQSYTSSIIHNAMTVDRYPTM